MESGENREIKVGEAIPKQEINRTTSLTKAIFNLSKSAIGLGAIFLPGNLQRMGLVGGIAMIVLGAIASAISLYLLNQMSHYYLATDYFELGLAAYGEKAALVDTIVLLLFQVGGMIVYCKFSGFYLSSAISLFMQKSLLLVPWWRSFQFFSIIIGKMSPLHN